MQTSLGSAMTTDGEALVPLTDEDLQHFQVHAASAISRRGGDFFKRQLAGGWEKLASGLLPMLGTWALGWSAYELCILFLVRSWSGIVCDILRLLTLQSLIMRFAKVQLEDEKVWLIAGAIRGNQHQVPKSQLRREYQPWLGVLVDLTFGVVGTVFIAGTLLTADDSEAASKLLNLSLGSSIALIVSYQFLLAVWDIINHRYRGEEDHPVQVACGLRGVALFLLMFIPVAAPSLTSQPERLAFVLMIVVHVVIVLGGIMTLIGCRVMRSEVNWLSQYLLDRDSEAVEAEPYQRPRKPR